MTAASFTGQAQGATPAKVNSFPFAALGTFTHSASFPDSAHFGKALYGGHQLFHILDPLRDSLRYNLCRLLKPSGQAEHWDAHNRGHTDFGGGIMPGRAQINNQVCPGVGLGTKHVAALFKSGTQKMYRMHIAKTGSNVDREGA
jgi:hypothetical protein